MRHADDDVLHAQRAAALDDLLQRRDQRLAAVQAEALGAGEALVRGTLEALGLDQLLQDGDLALRGEADLLVAALDALPAARPSRPGRRCACTARRRCRSRCAAGSPGSRGSSRSPGPARSRGRSAGRSRPRRSRRWPGRARRRRPAVIARPSGSRLAFRWPRIAVGADHHDGAQGIEGRGANRLGGRSAAGGGRWRRRARRSWRRAWPRPPATGRRWPTASRGAAMGAARVQAGSAAARFTSAARVVQGGEEGAPGGLDDAGSAAQLRVEVLHEGGVAAVEEGGLRQDLVDAVPRRPPCRPPSLAADPRSFIGRGAERGPPVSYGLSRVIKRPCSTSSRVSPSAAGEGDTRMPAASMAAILSSAPPLPPEMIAPA